VLLFIYVVVCWLVGLCYLGLELHVSFMQLERFQVNAGTCFASIMGVLCEFK